MIASLSENLDSEYPICDENPNELILNIKNSYCDMKCETASETLNVRNLNLELGTTPTKT